MQISDHQQSWGYEDGPWKGPGPPLLVVADLSTGNVRELIELGTFYGNDPTSSYCTHRSAKHDTKK